MTPEAWSSEPERRYAASQHRLADYYDVEIDSRVLDTASAGRIHYLEAGDPDGEPVLLLHGATGQAAYWLPMVPALEDRFRLIMPDMPGEGLSAKPSYHGRELRRFLVAYLIECLDALDLAQPHVIGHSFGGGQAFVLALDHERVDRLCLVGAPVGLSSRFPLQMRLMSIRGLNRVLLWLLSRGDPVDNAREWIGLFVEDASAIPELYYQLYAIREELPGLQASLRSLMAQLTSFGRAHPLVDITDEVVGIERPTTFVWGSADYYWAPKLGRSVAERMADASFHELDGHGHTPWLEPGCETEDHVRRFLDD